MRENFSYNFCFIYLPISNILYQSFFVDGNITIEGYIAIFHDSEIILVFLRSFIVALITSSIALLVAIYSIKYFFISKSSSFFFLIFSILNLILPEIVLALSLFMFFNYLHIPLGYITLIISHVAFSISYTLPLLNQKWQEVK